jgi:Uma2 family endonuclease
MFTDLLKLPVDGDRATQSDQILSLSNMSWSDYEKLTGDEYFGYHVSYLNGVITIVSPSRNHEIIERTISLLINAYCRTYHIIYFQTGSTTLKHPPLAGKEPDTSYCFETLKDIPDLAVEVIYSSGSIGDSLARYKYLKVKEVWFWQNHEMKFYQLIDSDYVAIEKSVCLDKISPDFLVPYVNRGLTESPLIIEADYVKELDLNQD